MQLFAPKYYEKFHCMADRCRHSCCVGWEIDVDEPMLAVYRGLAGEIGDRIRAAIREDAEGACFAMRPDGRCPLLDENGLCRIISALGDGYLCEICREHPRFYFVAGERAYAGLGAACEETARLILGEEDYQGEVAIGEADWAESAETGGDFDPFASRQALYALLSDAAIPYERRLDEIAERWVGALSSAETFAALLCALEYLDEAHRDLFSAYQAPKAPDGQSPFAERFFAYLVYRHAGAARDEESWRGAVGFALLLERLFRYLVECRGISPVDAAVAISEELEYSEENTEAIRRFSLRGACTAPLCRQ